MRRRPAVLWAAIIAAGSGSSIIGSGGCASCKAPAPASDAGVAASASASASTTTSTADPLAELRTFEEQARTQAKFLQTKTQDREFGADPYAIVSVSGSHVGILRGRDALVELDGSLNEVSRIATPRSPSAIAVVRGTASAGSGILEIGDVLVASELEPVLAHYRRKMPGPDKGAIPQLLERLPDIDLDGVTAVRDIAIGEQGTVYLVEEHDDRLITLRFTNGAKPTKTERRMPRGPIRLKRTDRGLFVMSLLDHTITGFRVDRKTDAVIESSKQEMKIDGPFWGFDAIDMMGSNDDTTFVIAGGAEDHPLDRTQGFFGYVDSFVYLYRWTPKGVTRFGAINVGELGLIVPKGIALRGGNYIHPTALITSYGGTKAIELAWHFADDRFGTPKISVFDIPPGTSAVASVGTLGAGAEYSYVAANPLLDSWLHIHGTKVDVVRAPQQDTQMRAERTDRERIGEALFFTELMAPSASSDESKSRFTCETCHFEGYVDGRVHHTGRGDIRATTKPLVGLFNNRPHFSRALDPDLSAVAENEFRVASAPSKEDPHFEVDPAKVKWLAHLGISEANMPAKWTATELRLSLMSFLMKWTHRTNPHNAASRSFTPTERRGAEIFRDRCERCHQARASADMADSRVPYAVWEALVVGSRGESPLVWASDAYEKTGVLPYVHANGTRVPSLRRTYKKRPYFTNGSAASIANVLERARFTTDSFAHDASGVSLAGSPESLDGAAMRDLAAFLDLL